MSDSYFADLEGVPAHLQYYVMVRSLISALEVDDPEDTLLVALTRSEVTLITDALLVFGRMFPDLVGLCAQLGRKLMEVADAQEFVRAPKADDE